MESIDDQYSKITYDTYIESPCSPSLPEDDEWLGIIINVPEKYIVSAEKTTLPICGGYVLETANIMGLRPIVELYKITEPDLVISATISAPSTDRRIIKPPAMEPLDPALLEGMVTEAYFNINAAKHLSVPLLPGKYTVTVSFGEVTSNAKDIELSYK